MQQHLQALACRRGRCHRDNKKHQREHCQIFT